WPVLGLALVPVFLLIGGGEVALLTAGSVALFTLAYLAARTWVVRGRSVSWPRNIALLGWLLSFAVTMYLLSAVDSRLWGGLLLTMILAVVGIVASFPFGVLLALGRASTFPVIRLFCTLYIEVMRGVPLVIVLFMAFFFLPLMLEADRSMLGLPVTGIDLDVVQRAMIALTMFSAAYVAEIVRGGLQIVPRGQVEAAEALGLGTARILGLIVLPQALRAVIPALVGQFISLFKDTSLVLIMGLTELLAAARIVTAQQDFIGKQAESLLFVALIYWLIAFSMSRASQRLEQTLGVGER
ncbi:MAG: amino acid ABC transporter permease, partial [Chloroflexi bacterium]|nr:amino acid ABC transporter permease [Chloroflexota bacterium]